MALSAGTKLGPYEIVAPLGAGGMGEVWQARDTRLGRDVALKVLPETFAQDHDRLARFQREAQVLASLNHPNIAAIYGLEEADSIRALVLELVDGPTLADRITRGPVPLDEALPIARQIAEALEVAHEHGIIHRDLKPANIKVREDGAVKVLDFGLAKALEGSATAVDMSQSPTITSPAVTGTGVILGTAAYMSPEQARGKPVDKRADIWAFGCVLYEMLTGQRAFQGDDVSDTLATVLKSEPAWSALPSDVPPAIRMLIQRCLEKDRNRRVTDISTAVFLINEPSTVTPVPGGAHAPSVAVRRSRERIAWLVAGALLLVGALSVPFAVVHFREPAPDNHPIRFVMLAPEKGSVSGTPPSISPDGRRLAFVGTLDGKTQLWIRPIDSATAQPLVGTDGADYPFWSPDSRFIGFFADGRLRKIDASGGPPQTLCGAPAGRGGAWNRDGVIIFAPVANGPLHRVSSSGGATTPLTAFDGSGREIGHRNPSFLPDGRSFLFFVAGGEGTQGIYLGSLETKDRRLLLRGNSNGVYASPGYLLFVTERTLMAQRLDVKNLDLSGEAFPIAEPVGFYNTTDATFSVSDTGVLAHANGNAGGRQLAWFDRAGRLVERIGSPMPLFDIALSPDQKRAAIQWAANDIRVVDLVRGGIPSRLTFNPSIEDLPL